MTSAGRTNQPPTYKGRSFASLPDLRASACFQHSKGAYAPAFEANGTGADPWFESMSPDGLPAAADDVRLKLDLLVAPDAGRDIGCCAHGSAPLEVGVDARRRFPEERGTGYSGPRREDQ